LHDPGRQAGEVLGHPPVAARRAWIDPGELAEAFPLVVDVVLRQVAPARLQRDDADALLGKLVRNDPAAGAGPDDDDDRVVVQIEWCCHGPAPSEPVDVVEAAVDVTALGEALALVAEDRPDLLLVVEPGDEPAAHRLEEG